MTYREEGGAPASRLLDSKSTGCSVHKRNIERRSVVWSFLPFFTHNLHLHLRVKYLISYIATRISAPIHPITPAPSLEPYALPAPPCRLFSRWPSPHQRPSPGFYKTRMTLSPSTSSCSWLSWLSDFLWSPLRLLRISRRCRHTSNERYAA